MFMACPGDRPFVPLSPGSRLVISGMPESWRGEKGTRSKSWVPVLCNNSGICWFGLLEPTDAFMGWQFPAGGKGCLIKGVGEVLYIIASIYRCED